MLKCACAASHHWEGNACVPFQWFSWIYSDWVLTFRISLTLQLSIGRHKFLRWWIKNFRQHNHFNYSSGNHDNVVALFDSYHLRCDLFYPPIRLFIGFSMLFEFFRIQLSCTLCWLQNTPMKNIWLEVHLRKILRLNCIFLIWHCCDHSVVTI